MYSITNTHCLRLNVLRRSCTVTTSWKQQRATRLTRDQTALSPSMAHQDLVVPENLLLETQSCCVVSSYFIMIFESQIFKQIFRIISEMLYLSAYRNLPEKSRFFLLLKLKIRSVDVRLAAQSCAVFLVWGGCKICNLQNCSFFSQSPNWKNRILVDIRSILKCFTGFPFFWYWPSADPAQVTIGDVVSPCWWF